MTAPALEDRIRRIEDRFAIQDLAIRYCVATDAGDRETLLDLFTEDATLAGLQGRDDVVGMLHSVRGGYGATLHVPEAHLVQFGDDDSASGLILARAELAIKDRTVHTAIRYYDEYRRCPDGRWRFAARALKFAYAVPVEELADSLTAPDPVRWPGTEPAPADRF